MQRILAILTAIMLMTTMFTGMALAESALTDGVYTAEQQIGRAHV